MIGEKRKTEQTTIRIEVGLLAATREFAKSERRTVSGLIARALEWVMEEPAAFSAWEMGRRLPEGGRKQQSRLAAFEQAAREMCMPEHDAEEEREAAAEFEAALAAGDADALQELAEFERWAAEVEARKGAASGRK